MDSHTLPRKDLAELLEYAVLHYYKDIPKPRGMDTFAKGLARTCAVPRKTVNQCIRLVVETGNNTQNALEPESDVDSLTVEPDIEPRDFPS